MSVSTDNSVTPWNQVKLVGQKVPLRLRDIWATVFVFSLPKRRKTWPSSFWPSIVNYSAEHLSTRQHARIVKAWVNEIGLDVSIYGTHTMRRTKASLIYRRTKNFKTVQLLLGHTEAGKHRPLSRD